MLGRLHHVVLDCPDPAALAAFYSRLRGQPITYQSDDWVVVAANDTSSGLAFQLAPICRALSAHGIAIAPRTCFARRAAAPGKRALWDTAVAEILAGIYEPGGNGRRPPESLYGTVKMWACLNRQGIPVARCTVERLRRARGWRGAGYPGPAGPRHCC